MDQFNSNTYKSNGMFQEFFGSCLGKIVVLAVFLLGLFIVAIATQPDIEMVVAETEDNLHQCLQDNDIKRGDVIDEVLNNVSRTFNEADSTVDDHEIWAICQKYNRIEVFEHTGFSTARIVNNIHPQGIRAGIGIFGIVISTIYYDDLVLTTGPVRGEYYKRLLDDVPSDDDDLGENPALVPYHYEGNPEN